MVSMSANRKVTVGRDVKGANSAYRKWWELASYYLVLIYSPCCCWYLLPSVDVGGCWAGVPQHGSRTALLWRIFSITTSVLCKINHWLSTQPGFVMDIPCAFVLICRHLTESARTGLNKLVHASNHWENWLHVRHASSVHTTELSYWGFCPATFGTRKRLSRGSRSVAKASWPWEVCFAVLPYGCWRDGLMVAR